MCGEHADDMVDGFCCSYCGMYFIEPNGFPCLCDECWDETKKSDRAGLQRSLYKTVDKAEDGEGGWFRKKT